MNRLVQTATLLKTTWKKKKWHYLFQLKRRRNFLMLVEGNKICLKRKAKVNLQLKILSSCQNAPPLQIRLKLRESSLMQILYTNE